MVQTRQKAGSMIWLLELAVPVFSLGGALAAIIFSGSGGDPVDLRYFATGCIIGSFILAYLAWIRPHKDIVALTTPIYSVFFFVMPSDFSVGIILILLYAVSLTLLLVRLKLRFGVAHTPENGGQSLKEPLKSYCETVRQQAAGIPLEAAHAAAVTFARFAQGEYREAAQAAGAATVSLTETNPCPPLVTAFAIVREQALLLDESTDQPEQFIEFSASDAAVLAKPLSPADQLNDRFEVSLDNALLLLFATAWNASAKDQPVLLLGQSFALKIFNP
ncbi:MAG: hypothetical protein M0R30_13345 [Methanoregula sp.]|nr:hypothetical protein [Methanoregula sp.]